MFEHCAARRRTVEHRDSVRERSRAVPAAQGRQRARARRRSRITLRVPGSVRGPARSLRQRRSSTLERRAASSSRERRSSWSGRSRVAGACRAEALVSPLARTRRQLRIGARPETAIKSIDRRMPKASKETASEHETVEGYEGHFEHFDGGWTVGFETYTEDADLAPFFKGLPNDECQCEHMGYVIRGQGRLPLGRRRGAVRGRRRLLRRPGAHADPVRRHRGGRVQPDRGARPRRWRS